MVFDLALEVFRGA